MIRFSLSLIEPRGVEQCSRCVGDCKSCGVVSGAYDSRGGIGSGKGKTMAVRPTDLKENSAGPGPGAYNPVKARGDPSYSMRLRTAPAGARNWGPGPGRLL